MAFITPDKRWYPQLMHYAGFGKEFQLFVRAAQHKHFRKLAIITGIEDATAPREAVTKGHERLDVGRWQDFHFERDFYRAMNLDKLDTIK